MSDRLRVELPGLPLAWARPYNPRGPSTRETSQARLDELAEHLWVVMKNTSWDPTGPMGMEARFEFSPGRTGKTVIVVERLKPLQVWPVELVWRDKTPDLDNLWKLCMEAVQHGGVVEDDKQIVKAAVSKIDRAG